MPPAQGDFMMQMQQMMGGMLGSMEGRLSKATDCLQESLTGQIGKAMDSIGSLNDRMAENERKLDEVVTDLESTVEKKVEESIRKLASARNMGFGGSDFPSLPGAEEAGHSGMSSSLSYATAVSSAPVSAASSVASSMVESRRDLDYWRARKSLRLRPIGKGDDKQLVIEYMKDHLKLEDSFIESMGEIWTERIPFGPKTRQKNEMLVRFTSVEARDVVRGSATNLAGQGADYGVRLEVPNHLKSDMKLLQSVSYDLKQRHPEARRNVLYDDEVTELVLDFCLREGQPWRRLTAGQAKLRKRGGRQPTNFKLRSDELDEILGAGESCNSE